MKPIKLKDMGIEEKLMRGILNNLYQDANAMTMFDATIANFSVGNALKKLGSLELKGYIKVEDIDVGEIDSVIMNWDCQMGQDYHDGKEYPLDNVNKEDIKDLATAIKAKLKEIAGIKD